MAGATVVLTWRPQHATEAERQALAASHAGMTQGWTGTMGQPAAHLATLGDGPR